jgi:hypothetical protein
MVDTPVLPIPLGAEDKKQRSITSYFLKVPGPQPHAPAPLIQQPVRDVVDMTVEVRVPLRKAAKKSRQKRKSAVAGRPLKERQNVFEWVVALAGACLEAPEVEERHVQSGKKRKYITWEPAHKRMAVGARNEYSNLTTTDLLRKLRANPAFNHLTLTTLKTWRSKAREDPSWLDAAKPGRVGTKLLPDDVLHRVKEFVASMVLTKTLVSRFILRWHG